MSVQSINPIKQSNGDISILMALRNGNVILFESSANSCNKEVEF